MIEINQCKKWWAMAVELYCNSRGFIAAGGPLFQLLTQRSGYEKECLSDGLHSTK